MKPCLKCAVAARGMCQPQGTETIVDGIGVKEMRIPHAGSAVPQHSHEYDHITYLAKGSVTVLLDGVPAGDRYAPTAIMVPAGVKHTFVTKTDGVLLLCIHNVSRNGTFMVREENNILGD